MPASRSAPAAPRGQGTRGSSSRGGRGGTSNPRPLRRSRGDVGEARAGNQVQMKTLSDWEWDHNRALGRSTVEKTFYKQKGTSIYRITKVSGFHSAMDAAYIKRSLQQESEATEDSPPKSAPGPSIDGWSDDESPTDTEPSDPMELDSASERKLQLDGFMSELSFQWDQASRNQRILGTGELANFRAAVDDIPSDSSSDYDPYTSVHTAPQSKFPEFTQNKYRENTYAGDVKMNWSLRTDEDIPFRLEFDDFHV
ncbi:hypothetical protein F5Y19DRAFT_425914 [Xylariaceae sp. FL1651]|nr:hypothetical protein F5Y19DRAFT_425914 [Xylariaceae sp. FL1651]